VNFCRILLLFGVRLVWTLALLVLGGWPEEEDAGVEPQGVHARQHLLSFYFQAEYCEFDKAGSCYRQYKLHLIVLGLEALRSAVFEMCALFGRHNGSVPVPVRMQHGWTLSKKSICCTDFKKGQIGFNFQVMGRLLVLWAGDGTMPRIGGGEVSRQP
jgi:hypothetical protein